MAYPHNDGTLNINDNLNQIGFDDSALRPKPLQRFSTIRTPLFPQLPQITDIQQMTIGNCYLLVAIQSIILRNPEYLTQIMCYDERTQRVYVRLFREEPQNNFIPVVFRIQRTRLQEFFVWNVHVAPWVNMIEKAYAGLRILTGRAPNLATLNDILKGGESDDAFKALLGNSAQRIAIVPERFSNRKSNVPFIFSHQIYENLFNILNPATTDELEQKRQISLEIIFPVFEQRNDFDECASPGDNIRIIELFNLRATENHVYHKILRQEDLIASLTNTQLYVNLLPETRETLVNYVTQHCPSKRGVSYVQNQTEHFEIIFSALSENKMVCVATDHFSSHFWNRSYTESSVNGLVHNHVYTVINAYERAGRKFLLLRNPWSRNFRRGYEIKSPINRRLSASSYTFRATPIVEIEQPYTEIATTYLLDQLQRPDQRGIVISQAIIYELNQFQRLHNVFELELTDLTKRFSDIYIGEF